MKYYEAKKLREKSLSACFERFGVFFAFSNKQLEEQKKEGVEYVWFGMGMVVPKHLARDFNAAMLKDSDDFTALVLRECDPIEVIVYELNNHEYGYTRDMTDTKSVLSAYGFSDKQYAIARKKYLSECED